MPQCCKSHITEKATYNFWTREVGGGSTTVVHFSRSTSAVVIVSVVVPKERKIYTYKEAISAPYEAKK